MSRIYALMLFFCVLLILSGCGSSGGGDDDENSNDNNNNPVNDPNTNDSGSNQDPGTDSENPDSSENRTIRMVGMVGLVENDANSNSGTEITAFASFLEYEASFDVPEGASSPFSALVGTCEINNSGSDDFDDVPEIEPEDNTEFVQIDAGEAVKISSAGNDYLNLARFDVGGSAKFYGSEEISGPMSPDLTLDIPGAVFPAFSNVPMTTVTPVNLSSPTNGAVRFDTTFTWQAGNNPDVLVFISASAFSTSVFCITTDSGSFEFPQDTQNELGTGFFGNSLSTSRVAYDIVFKDNAALIVFSSSQD